VPSVLDRGVAAVGAVDVIVVVVLGMIAHAVSMKCICVRTSQELDLRSISAVVLRSSTSVLDVGFANNHRLTTRTAHTTEDRPAKSGIT
jgi:hypothetical protein